MQKIILIIRLIRLIQNVIVKKLLIPPSYSQGVVYSDSDIHIELIPTVFNDRGKNYAESRSDADFAITADIRDKNKKVKKAILVSEDG